MKIKIFTLITFIVNLYVIPAYSQVQIPRLERGTLSVPVISRNGMVSSREKIASQVGADILENGGNAVDAAVAVGFTLAVTLSQSGNLAGGGFMVIHLAEQNKTIAIDYREMAPAGARRDMFLDADGEVDDEISLFSHKASAVPGTVAGLIHALENYGTMSLQQVMQPAYDIALNGFPAYYYMEHSLKLRQNRLKQNDAFAKVFFKPDGTMYMNGENVVQKDLADSLGRIMLTGKAAFYSGTIAEKIVAEMEANDGLITMEDLANYKVVEREAVMGDYKGYQIATMPPPSSGGVHLIQLLNMLENDDLKSKGHNSAANIHLYVEAMRQVFADRTEYLGDPDFVEVPVDELTSKEYAKIIRDLIPMDRARTSDEVAPALEMIREGTNTTHFSVMDKDGNAVSNTYSINFAYGSGIMVPGTGIILNNEMDDFSAKPGTSDTYGLIGGEANAIEAGKRPLSSMTPTIVFKDGKVHMVTGTPGGGRIITAVLQSILNVVDFEMNVQDAVNAPRIHHQWLPDIIYTEAGISQDTKNILTNMGHIVDEKPSAIGFLNSIVYRNGVFYGANDPRSADGAAIGY
ncbi:MAG: gamma-glutamyltransferase [Kordiimonadaceae bacterium]|jgi:gamma-glutamyltranspeptidase / glutathione hydrolase|nr:gamma-glutamyltransferase [Kordiimonadaceae bacterium]MBT6033028.1 gamma-glutamyltransferase [Kordiimonadaceae bacterium]